MKRFWLSFYLISLSFQLLFAQNEFRPGYVILNNNDTAFGYVLFDRPSVNAEKCQFKENIQSMPKTFLPTDIKAYRFNDGRYYVSRAIEGENNTKTTVFLDYLVNGRLSIFIFVKNDGKADYYAEKDSGKVVLLKNSEVPFHGELQEKKEYIGMLKILTSDNVLSEGTERYPSLSSKSLVKYAKNYHSAVCPDQSCEIFEDKESVSITIGIYSDAYFSNLSIIFDQEEFVVPNNKIGAGLMLTFGNFRNLGQNFAFQTGLYFHNYSFVVDSVAILYSINKHVKSYDYCGFHFSYRSYGIPIMVMYNMDYGNFSFAGSSGFVGKIIRNQSVYKFDLNNSSVRPLSPKKFTIGFDAQLLVQYKLNKKIGLFAGLNYLYEPSPIINVLYKHHLSEISSQFGLSYSIGN